MLKRFFLRLLFAALAAAILWGFVTYPIEIFMPTVYETERLPTILSVTPTVPVITPPPAEDPQRSVDESAPVTETERVDILGLMYHDLTLDPTAVTPWTTTPDRLRQNIESLLSLGYLPLSIEDYVDGNYSLTQDYFIVTFDDGYLSNLTLALPVLRSLGVKAAVFVITESVWASNHMSWQQLREARATGVLSLYSHTHTHKSARSSLRDPFLADVRRSQEELSRNLGSSRYRILAYPGGAYTQATMQSLYREGWDLFVMQDKPAWYDAETDGKILLRVNVSGEDVDMTKIANYSRARAGLSKIGEKTGENP